jgi:predicted lipoprotein with Yx(FWY)xxD motif
MRKVLLAVPVTVVLAGCGAGGSAAMRAASAPVATSAAKHATVGTRHGKLGTYLVDGRGRTLYRFLKDTGRRSRCSGACAYAWPPLTTRERPEAEGAAKRSLLSTSRRAGGARQVVYDGHPLYRYAPDTAPGQTRGQGVDAYGARWYVVSPSGRVIRSAPASATPPSPYGY